MRLQQERAACVKIRPRVVHDRPWKITRDKTNTCLPSPPVLVRTNDLRGCVWASALVSALALPTNDVYNMVKNTPWREARHSRMDY